MSGLPQGPQSDAHKYSHLYNYSGANKAGMEGIDKEKQAQIIYEMSKDSAYFKRAAKLDAETDIKVQALKKTLVGFKGKLETKLRGDVLQHSMELERKRSFDRICCVLDMDMFFAAVEIRDQPHLKDLPVAVGGMSMISTANYVARKYGVRAAMPGFIARKLCPQLVFVHCNFEKYQIVSGQIIDIIKEYDPNYSSHSLDEVYFDLTNAATTAWNRSKYGDLSHMDHSEEIGPCPANSEDNANSSVAAASDAVVSRSASSHIGEEANATIAITELRAIAVNLLQEIRQRITTVTAGLTCSAGLANNFFLAKICADVNKPNGQYELPPTRQAVMDFVSELPTRKVGGIGKVTERMLDNLLSIKKMGQVRELLPQILHTCTPVLYQFLLRSSLGIGSEEGEGASAAFEGKDKLTEKKAYMRKSLGCERTYSSKGISDPAELHEKLHKICTHVADDMAEEGLWAKSVTLKLKNTEFELITRIATSPGYFNTVESIEALARGLLDELMPVNVRLMGVQVTKFKGADACETDPRQKNMLHFLKGKSGAQVDYSDLQKTPQELQPPAGTSPSSSIRATADDTDNGFASSTEAHTTAPPRTKGLDMWLQQQPQQQHRHRDVALEQDIVELCDEGGGDAPEFEPDEGERFSALQSTSGQVSPCSTHAAVDRAPPADAAVQSVTASAPYPATAAAAYTSKPAHECPVCGTLVPGSLHLLNVHLDACLGQDSSAAAASLPPSSSSWEKDAKRTAGPTSSSSSAAPGNKKARAGKPSGAARSHSTGHRGAPAGNPKNSKALELEITDYLLLQYQ